MARATILESLGGGLYRIQLHFDNTRVDTRLTYIAGKLADYVADLAASEPLRIAKAAELDAALTALNDYINATDPSVYVADPTELNAMTKASYTLRGELDVILHDEKIIKLKKASLEQEQTFLTSNTPASFETSAWCVELNEGLTGTTGTIDIDYAQIRSLSTNNPLYDTGVWLPGAVSTPDANLQHPFASSEHAVWFNLCMAPGLQRHAARYRVATISNLDQAASTCDVTFDGIESIDTGTGRLLEHLPIYPQISGAQASGYAGASIVYGVCNGYAFADGDRVIVDLHSGVGAPTVIGFYANPRTCDGLPGSEGPSTGGQNYQWTIEAAPFPMYRGMDGHGVYYIAGDTSLHPQLIFSSGNFDYDLRTVTTKTGTTSTAALWQDSAAVNNTITVTKSASEGNRTAVYNYLFDDWADVTTHWAMSYDYNSVTTETRDAYDIADLSGLYNRTVTRSSTETMTFTLSVTLPPAVAFALGTAEQIVYTYSIDKTLSETWTGEYSLFDLGGGAVGYAAYAVDQPVPAVTMTINSTETINDETFTFSEFNSIPTPSTYDRWQHGTTTTIIGSDTGQVIPTTEEENCVVSGSVVETNTYSTDGAVTASDSTTTPTLHYHSGGDGNDMSGGNSDVTEATTLPMVPILTMYVNLA